MQNALADFRNDIARIDAVAIWLVTPPAMTADMLPATIAIRCGAIVLLSGYFESFIRDCMEAFITSLNNLGKPLDKFPDRMKFKHFDKGSRVLARELKKARKSKDMTICADVSARLASVSASTGYTLLWEAFAETEANPGPGVIVELLGAVGIRQPWKKIEDAAPTGSGNLQLFLDSFIAMRNECAHSGVTASPPTPNDLVDYGIRLSSLAHAIVTLLEGKLVEYAAL